MAIALKGKHRARFVNDLAVHRETHAISDAQYAEKVLQVSLNTYKKCLPANKDELSLQRPTFVKIFANSGLDPKNYDLALVLPSNATPYGGYKKKEFEYLCGHYLMYRRSFLSARDITCGLLEIKLSATQECLSFVESHYYTAEVGLPQELEYTGDVYLNAERNLISLPAYENGHVRLMQLMHERVDRRGRIKFRGALLTFGNPKGYWQPTVSCIFAEGPITSKKIDRQSLCRTIYSDNKDYAQFSEELAHVEKHATNITPLMWANLNTIKR